MAPSEPKTIGGDGLFKLLAWKTRAIPRLLGLPGIKGEPIQQEYQFPRERRVDALYRLEDGSLLNIEHQSSVKGKEDLARRLITYHVMIKQEFPEEPLLQVVIFTGGGAGGPPTLGDSIEYASHDASGRHGVRFSAALVDFRSAPVDEFRASGLIDDLILGLMTQGGDDDAYIGDVVVRIRAMTGEAKTSAIEKFLAVCAMMPDRKIGQVDRGDTQMWINDVKDSPIVRQIVEIAGKGRIEEARRGGIAHSIVHYAVKHQIALPSAPEEVEAALAAHADETALDAMLDDVENMSDFNEFVKAHGVRAPGLDG